MFEKLHARLFGIKIGEDSFGNTYYKAKKATSWRTEKRWVLYNGLVEASKVPPAWHGWLHKTDEHPPQQENHWSWELPAKPNLTGTIYAYRPPGHPLAGGKRQRATGDYESWSPSE